VNSRQKCSFFANMSKYLKLWHPRCVRYKGHLFNFTSAVDTIYFNTPRGLRWYFPRPMGCLLPVILRTPFHKSAPKVRHLATSNLSAYPLNLARTYAHVITNVYEQPTHCTPCPKKIVPFFYFFSRCPVCGEWWKLHWLLLDTPSFDWNTRRSRGHNMFKMAPTKQQKAFCAVEYAKTTSGAFAFA